MDTMTIILIAGGVLAVIMLGIGLAVSMRSDRSMVEERLGKYVEKEMPAEKEKKAARSPVTDWINERVTGSSMGDNIARDLARADLKLKPGEYIATMIIATAGMGGLGFYLTGGFQETTAGIIGGLIGGAIGFFLPGMYVKRQQGRRLLRFNDQLGDMLNLMVNGLRAGYSTMQAMEAVSKELPPPICDEFRRVVQEMQLGVAMQTSLDNLLRRIPSEDLDLVITAVNVQREVGGNLAEILDTISYTIRERVRIKGEIRVLTTQVMYSGRFLSLLPVALMGALYLFNKPYMMEFFNPANNAKFPCGYGALACSAALIGAGYAVMNKLGDIEI